VLRRGKGGVGVMVVDNSGLDSDSVDTGLGLEFGVASSAVVEGRKEGGKTDEIGNIFRREDGPRQDEGRDILSGPEDSNVGPFHTRLTFSFFFKQLRKERMEDGGRTGKKTF
jgi:hypothetical protein